MLHGLTIDQEGGADAGAAWTLDRRGLQGVAQPLRRAALAELGDGSLAEYYEPVTGEPLGSRDQSWSAAAALDLLLARDWVD